MTINILLNKIRIQLQDAQTERASLGAEFKAAADLGDLPENSIYDDVKFRSQVLDYKIVELKELIKRLEVQNPKLFLLTNHTNNSETKMAIIDGHTDEAEDIKFISAQSPLAKKIRSTAPKIKFEMRAVNGTQIYSWELV